MYFYVLYKHAKLFLEVIVGLRTNGQIAILAQNFEVFITCKVTKFTLGVWVYVRDVYKFKFQLWAFNSETNEGHIKTKFWVFVHILSHC